ncbi:CBS domain-containing protein [Bacillus piscicola]|uniref:CBS domain-containing protein n=1 Tax=Bacillus piscicola TaxID=1632684 RepID=UPI001F08D17A|nr:CBS domain-containing protein [Bacillus piscicola]
MTTIGELMTQEVEHCSPSDNVYTLAKAMHDCDLGFLPIVENDELTGCVTDRDIVLKGLNKGVSPGDVHAESIMQEKVITGYPDMPVEEASRLMQDHQIKRLIVTEDLKLKGVVTLGDMAASKKADQAAGNAMSEISKPHPH